MSNKKVRQYAIPVTWRTVLFFIVMGLVSFGMLLLSGGNFVAAFVPGLLIAILAALFTLPLKHTVYAFFSLALLFHNPGGLPMGNVWQGPLYPLGRIIHLNIADYTGIGAGKLSVFQLAILTFLFIMGLRKLLHNNMDGHLTMPASRWLKVAAAISLGSVIFFIFWGIANGGDRGHMSLQSKMFIAAPLMMFVFMRAFKTEQTIRLAGKTLVVIAIIRIAEGSWFYFVHVIPRGLELEYIMTHSDSVLFVTCFILLLLCFIEKPCRRTRFNLFVWGGIIQWGLVINDRRVAFVSMALSIIVVFFFLEPKIRRKISRILVYLSPLIILYIGAGMHSDAKIFRPVQSVTSVSDQTDASNMCRDFENLNMLQTLKPNPIMGTGFGFPYIEAVPPCPLPFKGFQFIAHNHILWLAYLTGAVGVFLIWLPLSVGDFLAFRARLYATNSTQRIASLITLCTTICYMVQVFGDMGSAGIMENVLMAAGVAISANMAKRTQGV